MKLRTLAAGTIITAAAVAFSISASAGFAVVKDSPNERFASNDGMWLAELFSVGYETNYDIDVSDIAKLRVKIQAMEPDYFEGAIAGSIVASSVTLGDNTHNWVGGQYAGVYDEALGLLTADEDMPAVFYGNGDYTFTAVLELDETNYFCVYPEFAQVAVQHWGDETSEIKVLSLEALDINDNVIISFDETGKASLPLVEYDSADIELNDDEAALTVGDTAYSAFFGISGNADVEFTAEDNLSLDNFRVSFSSDDVNIRTDYLTQLVITGKKWGYSAPGTYSYKFSEQINYTTGESSYVVSNLAIEQFETISNVKLVIGGEKYYADVDEYNKMVENHGFVLSKLAVSVVSTDSESKLASTLSDIISDMWWCNFESGSKQNVYPQLSVSESEDYNSASDINTYSFAYVLDKFKEHYNGKTAGTVAFKLNGYTKAYGYDINAETPLYLMFDCGTSGIKTAETYFDRELAIAYFNVSDILEEFDGDTSRISGMRIVNSISGLSVNKILFFNRDVGSDRVHTLTKTIENASIILYDDVSKEVFITGDELASAEDFSIITKLNYEGKIDQARVYITGLKKGEDTVKTYNFYSKCYSDPECTIADENGKYIKYSFTNGTPEDYSLDFSEFSYIYKIGISTYLAREIDASVYDDWGNALFGDWSSASYSVVSSSYANPLAAKLNAVINDAWGFNFDRKSAELSHPVIETTGGAAVNITKMTAGTSFEGLTEAANEYFSGRTDGTITFKLSSGMPTYLNASLENGVYEYETLKEFLKNYSGDDFVLYINEIDDAHKVSATIDADSGTASFDISEILSSVTSIDNIYISLSSGIELKNYSKTGFVLNRGITFSSTSPAETYVTINVDENNKFYWDIVNGAVSYVLKASNGITEATDYCMFNDSTGMVDKMIQAGFESGTYTLKLYAVDSDGNEKFVGETTYELTTVSEEFEGNVFFYDDNGDGTANIKGGTINNGDVVIPSEIAGLKVVGISSNAFSSFDNPTANNIVTLTIPEGITKIGYYAFNTCQNLTSVTLPKSLDYIESWAFERCFSLKTINVPANVTTINGGAFAQNTAMTSITCDPDNKNYVSVDGVLFSKDMKTLVAYPGGLKGAYTVPASVKHIGDAAFYGAEGITSVKILGELDFIGFEAFAECKLITDVKINEGVTYVGYWAFRGCKNIKQLTVPQSVTNIGNEAFGFEGINYKAEDFTLRGYKDSSIYFYAVRHNIPFICIGNASEENMPFDDEDSKDTEVSKNPNSSEEDSITSITITPAFNLKDKSDMGVGLDLTNISVKANEIYDGEDLERAKEALGEEIVGNKHYNLLDITLMSGTTDISESYDGLIKVLIPIPKGHSNKEFYCYRILDDGTKEIIPGKRVDNNYVIYLEHFSMYAFVADDVHTCSYSTNWSNDDKNHWHECSCGKTKDISAHTISDWIIDNEATYSEAGNKYKECTTCGYVMETEIIPAGCDLKPVVTATPGENQVTLSWNAINGATKYVIVSYEIGSAHTYSDTCTDTSYTVTGLTGGKEYTFAVQAYVDGSWSALTETDYVKATPVAPAPDVSDFVNRLYNIFLGREAEEAGLKDWSDKLTTGEASAAEIVHGIAASPEFQNQGLTNAEVVEKLYEAMLGRASDAEGKANWLKYLDVGMTVDVVINGFTGSIEFAGICKTYGIKESGVVPLTAYRDRNYNLTAFVSRMYTKALNRTYDISGLEDWSYKLISETIDVQGLAFGFIFSPEFVGKGLNNSDYVDTLYRTFFDREPDEGGKSDWMNRLANGTAREDVMYGFVGSQECINLVRSFGLN